MIPLNYIATTSKLFIMANYDEGRESMVPSTMRIVFGIIMIIVYVGMGVLLLINFFDWHTPLLTWLRWIGGILFIIYGIWRAIRQFWGIDSSIWQFLKLIPRVFLPDKRIVKLTLRIFALTEKKDVVSLTTSHPSLWNQKTWGKFHFSHYLLSGFWHWDARAQASGKPQKGIHQHPARLLWPVTHRLRMWCNRK